jgi:hypothetical protein
MVGTDAICPETIAFGVAEKIDVVADYGEFMSS